MSECLCENDKAVDPLCCAAGMCAREEVMEIERAELGIDGNAGFALLGEDLQSGEAEFVEIALPPDASKDPNRYHKIEWCRAAEAAASLAFVALKLRLPDRKISYYLGQSHPRHLG